MLGQPTQTERTGSSPSAMLLGGRLVVVIITRVSPTPVNGQSHSPRVLPGVGQECDAVRPSMEFGFHIRGHGSDARAEFTKIGGLHHLIVTPRPYIEGAQELIGELEPIIALVKYPCSPGRRIIARAVQRPGVKTTSTRTGKSLRRSGCDPEATLEAGAPREAAAVRAATRVAVRPGCLDFFMTHVLGISGFAAVRRPHRRGPTRSGSTRAQCQSRQARWSDIHVPSTAFRFANPDICHVGSARRATSQSDTAASQTRFPY